MIRIQFLILVLEPFSGFGGSMVARSTYFETLLPYSTLISSEKLLLLNC